MENYKCQCGAILDTPEEYLEHLKQEIEQMNRKTMEEEAGIIHTYYNEVGQ
jgi:hypothetical protein